MDWLLTGEGEMLKGEGKSGNHQVAIGNGGNVLQAITLSDCEKEVLHLRELLAEKERSIQDKERLIQVLLNKL